MTEAYVIINRKPFCLWMNKEVGITTHVSGNTFGWIDNRGRQYVASKYEMKKPTDEQIYTALGSNSKFAELCIKMKLVKPSGTWSIEMGPFMDGVCMN
jgi:hypothetical protein